MKFFAIDVETANADMASICAIGVAEFEDREVKDEWYSLVNPRDYFSEVNVGIHGITEGHVADAPTYAEVSSKLNEMLGGAIAVTHTHFDRVAIHQAAHRWNVPLPNCRWLDSARVARRAWKEFAAKGYGLKSVCERIGYEFKHHHALEDAKAAGQIIISAVKEGGISVEDWLGHVELPIDPSVSEKIARDGNPEGHLFGEVIVFTGALQVPRRHAAELAAKAGCEVAQSVTGKTTILVVGDLDIQRLAGHEKSSKHRKAEELAGQGQAIRIIRETDFQTLVTVS